MKKIRGLTAMLVCMACLLACGGFAGCGKKNDKNTQATSYGKDPFARSDTKITYRDKEAAEQTVVSKPDSDGDTPRNAEIVQAAEQTESSDRTEEENGKPTVSEKAASEKKTGKIVSEKQQEKQAIGFLTEKNETKTVAVQKYAAAGQSSGSGNVLPHELTSVSAVYLGPTLLVNDLLDLSQLRVMGLYLDGSYEELHSYSLSTYVAEKVGMNTITAEYLGKTATFTVTAKELTDLIAFSSEASLTVGSKVDKSKISVWATFSDHSLESVTDFVLHTSFVDKEGENKIKISYRGMEAEASIYGLKIKKPTEIYAHYSGGEIIVGHAPERSDFTVMIFFDDGSSEKVESYELAPTTISTVGPNTVSVYFSGLKKDVTITGVPKVVTSIKAEYTGFPLVIGTAVSNADIRVEATYNDYTKDTVTNFTLSNPIVYTIGDNALTVFCENCTSLINVRGVEAEIIDFTNCAVSTVGSGNVFSEVSVAANPKADPRKIGIGGIDAELVRKAMNRIVKTDKFMACDIYFEDPDLAVYLPMTVRVTVPSGYDKDNFGVFYSPNRKTIMAKMNGEFLPNGVYEFKMFQPGTYIIADCTEKILVESILYDTEEITVGRGKSMSLRPVVYPFTATNPKLEYSSTREQIAVVDEYGMVTGVAVGTTIIVIESTDGSEVSKRLRLTVTP